ncbi:hypothetical protein BC830DRAFT_1096918 [Chytriomyces sp. MP71]|nr:hypothetical protein BC830DRAFT_1096918 [Chytriomyces sp. MP71]
MISTHSNRTGGLQPDQLATAPALKRGPVTLAKIEQTRRRLRIPAYSLQCHILSCLRYARNAKALRAHFRDVHADARITFKGQTSRVFSRRDYETGLLVCPRCGDAFAWANEVEKHAAEGACEGVLRPTHEITHPFENSTEVIRTGRIVMEEWEVRRSRTEEGFRCHLCTAVKMSRSSLNYHMQRYHTDLVIEGIAFPRHLFTNKPSHLSNGSAQQTAVEREDTRANGASEFTSEVHGLSPDTGNALPLLKRETSQSEEGDVSDLMQAWDDLKFPTDCGFQCHLCGILMPARTNLVWHMRHMHTDVLFRGILFARNSQGLVTCYCGQDFETGELLASHVALFCPEEWRHERVTPLWPLELFASQSNSPPTISPPTIPHTEDAFKHHLFHLNISTMWPQL